MGVGESLRCRCRENRCLFPLVQFTLLTLEKVQVLVKRGICNLSVLINKPKLLKSRNEARMEKSEAVEDIVSNFVLCTLAGSLERHVVVQDRVCGCLNTGTLEQSNPSLFSLVLSVQ